MLDERIKKKLSKLFDKYGVTEDDVKEILAPEQEAPTDEIPAEPAPVESKTEIDEGEPTEEVEAPAVPEATEEPAQEPQEQVEEEPAEPAEGTEQLPEPPAQPEETPVEQEPATDPRVDELEKAIEGLSSRLDAFIDSLKKAGVLVEAQASQVGIETQGFGDSPKEESIGDTLARLNRGKAY